MHAIPVHGMSGMARSEGGIWTYENGIGVVRMRSKPVSASTSWLRDPIRLARDRHQFSHRGALGEALLAVGGSMTLRDCKAATYELCH